MRRCVCLDQSAVPKHTERDVVFVVGLTFATDLVVPVCAPPPSGGCMCVCVCRSTWCCCAFRAVCVVPLFWRVLSSWSKPKRTRIFSKTTNPSSTPNRQIHAKFETNLTSFCSKERGAILHAQPPHTKTTCFRVVEWHLSLRTQQSSKHDTTNVVGIHPPFGNALFLCYHHRHYYSNN